MTILDTYTDMAGKIRVTCLLSNGEMVNYKFSTEPTEEELLTLETLHLQKKEVDSYPVLQFDLRSHKELLKEFVKLIKENPAVTLTQYNNWLGTKSWEKAAVIRFFVFSLATQLADRADVSLSNFTESQVLAKLRDWIVDAPLKKINRIVFGE